MVHRLKNRGRLSYGFTLRDTASDNNTVESDVVAARISYTTKPLKMGVTPTFSLNLERTEYSNLVIGNVTRANKRTNATVSVLFPEVSYYGFSPSVNMTASRKKSTVDIYSTKNPDMNRGFQSSF
jgi:hypothetical protein